MWRFSSCEVQGKGHIKNQVPCQDKTKTVFLNNTYVISLSDGAGSAKLSHYGATRVVDSMTELFVSDFDKLYEQPDGRQVKITIMEKLLIAIKDEADILSCEMKDLAATMLAVAVKDNHFIIAHIGDGVIGYLDGDDLKVASAPSNGEHANETYFVTSKDAITSMKLFKGEINNISGFVLMSDGTEQSLYNKSNNRLSGAVLKLMQRNVLVDESVMRDQLESTFKNIIIDKTHDDCSIALLSKPSNLLRTVTDLSFEEKCALYRVNNNDANCCQRIERYDLIVDLLKQTNCSCDAVSKKIKLNPKHTKRHLEHLISVGLIKKDGCLFHLS